MDRVTELENKTIYILREANYRFKNKFALLWSIGKDSTTLLWIARKAFFGKLPFPVLHIDTSYKFKEIYEFRKKYTEKWNLDLLVTNNNVALKNGMNKTKGTITCCNALKTDPLKMAIQKYGFTGLGLAIRRDEHGIRAKERYFSPREEDFSWNYENQPPEMWDLYKSQIKKKQHIRVHPMLDWTEQDIWKYIQRENIPVCSLYFSKNGARYRSIGCEPCCATVQSKANTLNKIIKELDITRISERAGRAQDKESSYTMQKLRSLGYM